MQVFCSLVSIYLDSPQLDIQYCVKNCVKLCKTLDYLFRDILKFVSFRRRSLGIISTPHFEYDFSRKLFFILYSIN